MPEMTARMPRKRIGVRRALIIGALVLAVGMLLLRGAWADSTPQVLPNKRPSPALTANSPGGTGDSAAGPRTYPYRGGGYGGMMGGSSGGGMM